MEAIMFTFVALLLVLIIGYAALVWQERRKMALLEETMDDIAELNKRLDALLGDISARLDILEADISDAKRRLADLENFRDAMCDSF